MDEKTVDQIFEIPSMEDLIKQHDSIFQAYMNHIVENSIEKKPKPSVKPRPVEKPLKVECTWIPRSTQAPYYQVAVTKGSKVVRFRIYEAGICTLRIIKGLNISYGNSTEFNQLAFEEGIKAYRTCEREDSKHYHGYKEQQAFISTHANYSEETNDDQRGFLDDNDFNIVGQYTTVDPDNDKSYNCDIYVKNYIL